MERLKNLTAQHKRWISFILALLAFFMLWASWIVLKGDAREDWQKRFSEAEELADQAENLVDDFDMYDVDLRLSEAKKIVKAVKDGGISIVEGRFVLSKFAKLANQVADSDLGGFYMDRETKELISGLNLWNVACQILFWLTVASTLWSAACRVLTRKDVVSTASPILLGIWLIAALAAAAKLNAMADESIMRITGWAVLAPVCALASLLVWNKCFHGLEKLGGQNLQGLGGNFAAVKEKGVSLLQEGKQAINAAAATQKPWLCTGCGAQMEAGKKFCSACGAKRPEPHRCAACGAVQEPGVEFCANCGARFKPQRKCAACGAVLKEEDRFCAKCGAVCKEEQPAG